MKYVSIAFVIGLIFAGCAAKAPEELKPEVIKSVKKGHKKAIKSVPKKPATVAPAQKPASI